MNQMRTFLIFAWLMVATILWMSWNKEQSAPPTPTQVAQTAVPATPSEGLPPPAVPGAVPAAEPTAKVPAAKGQPVVAQIGPAPAAAPRLTLSNDVLRLSLDGGSVRRAELLRYRVSREPDAPLVRLFDDGAENFYIAQSGWTSAQGAPSHQSGFVAEQSATELKLADGAKAVSASYVWTGAEGVSIRRTFTLARGEYALKVRDEVVNRSGKPWTGHIYRYLSRVPHVLKRGMTNPESFSFNGAVWYTPKEKYEKRAYDKFVKDGPLNITTDGGWIALLQHYFFAGWIPQADQKANFALANAGNQAGITATGPEFTVAPGTQASSVATLWIGPKLPELLAKQAPGFERALDYGIFTFLAEPIHWLLAKLHLITGNWGWAIMFLVLLLKLALYPLSAAQYKSMAKMRKFQPRMQQLKERYGDDKQKYQVAMMELYKKEKINPAGGCLPILIQMPVFLALYWVLIESVELRQAPWMLWIQDLTARDPFFILPAINMAVMWFTQRLTPMVGVDPIQARMMQMMPLIFGVMFAFFPAGLVLYWVTNGSLGMLQQLWMMRQYGDKSSTAEKA
ncbi:MAG: membrane protein insertase YidC [Lysobacteraceae bacterium]